MSPPSRASLAPARLPRALHPLAWWVWAVGLATAASRTADPVVLLLTLAVLGLVVSARRADAPWARALRYYLYVGLLVVGLRIVFRVVFPGPAAADDTVLLHLPQLPLPGWFAGVQVGGAVTLEAVTSAALDGLRLATLIACLGAANALANPRRVLQLLPGALYELGAATTVAVSAAPQLVESVQRIRRAQRLRGGSERGLSALRAIAVPTLHDALDRSLRLAAGMDSRGYGRSGTATPATRRAARALLLGGLLALCVGVYALLDPTTPRALAGVGVGAGVAASVAGLALGGRRVSRTRYRPDPWRWPESVVAAGGVLVAAVSLVLPTYDPFAPGAGAAADVLGGASYVALGALLLAAAAGFAAPVPAATTPSARPAPAADRAEVAA
ncbi:energy-coupling factor transporter transmembrane component T [Lapillicoccus jejuensis]|uniref:energy-coupling factor transporter transmembrane component T n=1 Tax=Lapillicoccus jejuensis TaxID=402171 RepID=UPI001B87676A|nr:energy-coupling factor transporter transmembrane component T [Lapillicoccus jejuensis]